MGYFNDIDRIGMRQCLIVQSLSILDLKINAVIARLGVTKEKYGEFFETVEAQEAELNAIAEMLAAMSKETNETTEGGQHGD